MSILFLALEYWPSDIPNNAIYSFSSRYWNSSFSVIGGLVSSTWVSAEKLKEEMYWQIKPLIFSSHQNLDSPKVPTYAFTFYLSWHAKSSLTATTGFMSSTRSQSKAIRFSRVLVLITILSVPCNRLLRVRKKSRSVYLIWSVLDFLAQVFP